MSVSERQPGPLFYSRAGKSCSQRLHALKLEGAVLSSESPKKVAPALPLMKALHKAEMSKEALDKVIVKEMKALKADMHAYIKFRKAVHYIPLQSEGKRDSAASKSESS